MRSISCAVAGIYGNGSWYDDPALLASLREDDWGTERIEVCAEVYPGYDYDRPPLLPFGGDEAALDRATALAEGVRQSYSRGAASVLVRLENACVSRTIVHALDENETGVLYETHRPLDRAVVADRDAGELRMVEDHRRADPFVAPLWIGSTGTFGSGQWLVDDLPRLRALTELRRIRPFARIQVVMPGFGPAHDRMRAESCGAVCKAMEIDNVELVFVDPEARTFFDELYYVSPATHHPVLKSPAAMRFVAEHGVADHGHDAGTTPSRIFVGRGRGTHRQLVNADEIVAVLRPRGFIAVDLDRMPYPMLARLFRDAEYVVGCMGSAMAGTIFCRPGTRVGHLAPGGWIEPFYWDLAAACGHHHAVCFGHIAPGPAPVWNKNYRLNPQALEAMLARLDETTTDHADPFRF